MLLPCVDTHATILTLNLPDSLLPYKLRQNVFLSLWTSSLSSLHWRSIKGGLYYFLTAVGHFPKNKEKKEIQVISVQQSLLTTLPTKKRMRKLKGRENSMSKKTVPLPLSPKWNGLSLWVGGSLIVLTDNPSCDHLCNEKRNQTHWTYLANLARKDYASSL